MSLFKAAKKLVDTAVNAATGCTCGPGGIAGGCHCDFLDEKSPTTADVQNKLGHTR